MIDNDFTSFIEQDSSHSELGEMIRILNETIWSNSLNGDKIMAWINNFNDNSVADPSSQKLNALYLLSQFMFFGTREIRYALKYMYEHLFMYPVIRNIRKDENDSLDEDLLLAKYREKLSKTRFLGLGNPAESGCHLLYYFRQENNLLKNYFIHPHEVFKYTIDRKRHETIASLADGEIEYYIFIDDLSGSGEQASTYSSKIIENIKLYNPSCKCLYLVLFGTLDGVKKIKDDTLFDSVECVFELDESFKTFSDESRIMVKYIDGVSREICEAMSTAYGVRIYDPHYPHGYNNGQLLLAMSHNTPDNTLPIFWSKYNNWIPIFPRYDKKYC